MNVAALFHSLDAAAQLGYSEQAAALFRARAIDPAVAARMGVDERDGTLLFPGGRRRRLPNGKTIQPKGQPLAPWFFPGSIPTALVCEGETDALAAKSAAPTSPAWIVALPGVGFPADRLASELKGHEIERAFLCPDGDEGGRRFAERVGPVIRGWGIACKVAQVPEGSDLAAELRDAENPPLRLRYLLLAAEDAPTPERKAPIAPRAIDTPDDLRELETRLVVEALTGEEVSVGRAVNCPLPHHSDRTPSFVVYPDSRGYHCFGCQSGGSNYDFAMAYWNVPFKDAKERLSEIFGREAA